MTTIDILGVPHIYELTPPPSPSRSPVLVFVHGWLLSRHYWRPLVNLLAPNYQCLIYDLRGFGDSPPGSSSRGYTLAEYAQDLIILLEKLQLQEVWLVGHSLGGSIALWVADLCPQKVQGVICLNSGGGIYLKEEFERFRVAGQQLLKNRPSWLLCVPLLDLLFAQTMVARPLARQWGRQRLLDFLNADGEAALRALLDSTTEQEVHLLPQIVARLKQPVYFIAGLKDKIMEPKYVHHLASFHPLFQNYGGNVWEIPDCGHLAMLEHPHLVEDQIRTLLREDEARCSKILSSEIVSQ